MLKQDQDLGDETLEISRLIVEFSLRKIWISPLRRKGCRSGGKENTRWPPNHHEAKLLTQPSLSLETTIFRRSMRPSVPVPDIRSSCRRRRNILASDDAGKSLSNSFNLHLCKIRTRVPICVLICTSLPLDNVFEFFSAVYCVFDKSI